MILVLITIILDGEMEIWEGFNISLFHCILVASQEFKGQESNNKQMEDLILGHISHMSSSQNTEKVLWDLSFKS